MLITFRGLNQPFRSFASQSVSYISRSLHLRALHHRLAHVALTSQSAGRSAAPGQHKVLRGHTPSQGRFRCPRSEYSIRGAMSISHLSNSLRMAQLSLDYPRGPGTRALRPPSVVPEISATRGH